jgi:hypothetical protein
MLDQVRWFSENAISSEEQSALREFIPKPNEELAGVLCGFDRLEFQGALWSIRSAPGRRNSLWAQPVRRTEGGGSEQGVSEGWKPACRARAEALGRPEKDLAWAGESQEKEEVAGEMAAREKMQEGLVWVLRGRRGRLSREKNWASCAAKRGMGERRNGGACCAAGWRICIGAGRFRHGRRNALWMRGPVWTNRAGWKNGSPGGDSRGQGKGGGCARDVGWEKIARCWKRSAAGG